jgi:zinc transport system substrate-binding protein
MPGTVMLLGLASLGDAQEPLVAVVSVAPQSWLVEQIGGERVDVKVLVAPGENPAFYQPTDAQVTRLVSSVLYFRIGVPFEDGPWFEAVHAAGRLDVVNQCDGIEIRGDDPHIWLSPRRLKIQARTVAAALMRVDPEHRSDYETALQRVEVDLDRLDGEIQERLRPFAGRVFFVYHPSWSYFAEDYDLRQVAVETDGKDPGDHELTELLLQAREEEVSVVFVQPQIQGRGAEAVAAAIGGRVEVIDPLAPDIASNLITVTEKLVESFAGGGGS